MHLSAEAHPLTRLRCVLHAALTGRESGRALWPLRRDERRPLPCVGRSPEPGAIAAVHAVQARIRETTGMQPS